MQAEELLGEKGLPFTCFRPQYIYGPKQGKSYLAPFFDRACRELPPRPAPAPRPAPRSPQPAARSPSRPAPRTRAPTRAPTRAGDCGRAMRPRHEAAP